MGKKISEIFGFSGKEKEEKRQKQEITAAIQEINSLTERDVSHFYKSTDDFRTSVIIALRNIKLLIPIFSKLNPELFANDQQGVRVEVDYDTNGAFDTIVPYSFSDIAVHALGGLLAVSLESLKDGLKKILNKKFHHSSYGELYEIRKIIRKELFK